MDPELEKARRRVDRIFARYQQATGAQEHSPLPEELTKGKTYEAWVLCRVLDHLHQQESYQVTLMNSRKVILKSNGGPINRNYPHFKLDRPGGPSLEVWTDITFLTLSAENRSVNPSLPERCDYHELDIVVVPSRTEGRPSHRAIKIGIECKNLGYEKDMLRALLGVRRELSLLHYDKPTCFLRWPREYVPADPPSCLLAYGADPKILEFAPPGKTFGIDFVYEPLP